MRFNVELLLENEIIPKDKNRIILSLMKHNFNSYDKDYFIELYKQIPNKKKTFTFALYMGNCKFLREEIVIPEKKIILNFSTYDMKDGIMFYNSFLKNKGLEYPIKNNTIKVNKINLNKEKTITENEVIYKTLSPISVREHCGDNKKTWYHSLKDLKGQEVFINNLKYQLKSEFGEDRILDIEEIEFEVLGNKEVKVKNYGIEVLSNICRLKIKAKPYILDYLYKAGIGSQKSTGFGMVDLV
ncbi:CRISPR-associated endoribonuclease Cas6 [Anaerosalibacter massiliensis]|uniref:CRISPR-associated endoribonuclease Cas6 n=1 Tax=Anaerosalibacter massiliensis TaxID=1347392 RepID=A0A9X2MKE1_9FIRM|nr:CRISPR-associated endoribonuclease Cas6 [Anaerosalibacter massiliensis]MCR2045101.1 CRISPR-associated endoribonuclease Cas6 [Anaerosalibacter massiliensis]